MRHLRSFDPSAVDSSGAAAPASGHEAADGILGEIASPRVRSRDAWQRYELDHAVAQYARLIDGLRREGDLVSA